MVSKKRLLKSWKIYAILDDSLFHDRRSLLRKFSCLIESPVDAVQLRFHDLADPSIYLAAGKMAALARRRNVPLIINDRPEIALSLGASGVHLGKSDVSAFSARKVLGAGAIIGRTIRGAEDLESISKKDVDYVSVGPVFRTPIKPGLKRIPVTRLEQLSERSAIPLVAIGGINRDNVGEVTALGIKTVAFVRYGITEKDTKRKIQELRDAMI